MYVHTSKQNKNIFGKPVFFIASSWKLEMTAAVDLIFRFAFAYIANLRPPSAHRVRAIHHDPLFKGLTQPHSSRSLGRLLLEPKFKSN